MSGFSRGIQSITSTGGTVTITSPTGPTTNLETVGGGSSLFTQINAATSGAIAASVGDIINTTAGATITLPPAPTIGQAVLVNRGNHTQLITITANAGQSINGGGTAGSVSMVAFGSIANEGQGLFIAQSATSWTQISSGTDLNAGWNFGGNVGIQGSINISANSNLFGKTSINNSLFLHNLTETATYATAANDLWIRATSGTWTLTLTSSLSTNKMLLVTNEGTGTITVVSSTGVVNGVTSLPPGATATYLFNGTNWGTISSYGTATIADPGVVISPTVTSGVAFTPSSTANTTVYFQINATIAGSYTLTMGPNTGAENTIGSGVAMVIGSDDIVTLLVPAQWKVVLTATSVTIGSTTVVTR